MIARAVVAAALALTGCAVAPRQLPAAATSSATAATTDSAASAAATRDLPTQPMSAACAAGAEPAAAAAAALPAGELPPAPLREFRGAWVATVANIDWPSRPGLAATAQRAEALAILDRARAIGLNALILQVRTSGDAVYASALEPWSEFLSGQQGRAPGLPGEPPYDPLAFWVDEAHRRGLELHAWFNPYRARASSARSPLAAPHIGVLQPGIVKRYGDQLWLDPGEPAAAAQLLAVVADVVRRYDIDGVHIDDYFYPYPVLVDGILQPFPDDDSFARYRLGGGELARDDWRRANVDALVQSLYETAHRIKPALRVGISPFGIGRPQLRPPGIVGFSQYDRLYADVEHWLASGWLDYLAPQLYWPIASEGQPFGTLLETWIAANRAGRHLWPGLYASQVPRSWPAAELLDQLALLRRRAAAPAAAAAEAGHEGGAGGAVDGVAPSALPASSAPPAPSAPSAPSAPPAPPPAPAAPAVGGHIHFSMVALMQDRDGLATLLQFGPYAQPALVPATPWLAQGPPPAPPQLRRSGNQVSWTADCSEPAARWAVWRRRGGQWQFTVQPAQDRSVDVAGADALAVSAVDRVGQLGTAATLRLP